MAAQKEIDPKYNLWPETSKERYGIPAEKGVIEELFVRLSQGEELWEICNKDNLHMPLMLTVMRWRNKYPKFDTDYMSSENIGLGSTTIRIKKCYVCQSDKPIREFYKDKSRTDGLDNMCKPCKNKELQHKGLWGWEWTKKKKH